MAIPRPVKGEYFGAPLTAEEIRNAPKDHPDWTLAAIVVTYDDGTKGRPYRFCEVSPTVEVTQNDDGTEDFNV